MKYSLFTLVLLWLVACQKEQKLPILGERQAVQREKDGKMMTDTIYHKIPAFSFVNQDGEKVTEKTFEGKIYVTDFFFTTCPSICPKMKQQMLRVYEKYKSEDRFLLLSHSISREDSVPVLKAYAKKINIETKKWHLVTGKWSDIEKMAQQHFVGVKEDPNEPGGYIHNGYFVLIDKSKHIRGAYDGTNPKEVDKLMTDIDILLNEK
ncbi:MAG: SCO family protein [Thermonemataceae bacterium]|nr:SCO family protein [Thermonemataceae bacterium]